MSIRVFKHWDANPSVDRHDFKLSDIRGQELQAAGSHFLVTCSDGGHALLPYPPPEEHASHANFSDAWKMRPSGPTRIPVWQLVTA
jgi:hypothetical protein